LSTTGSLKRVDDTNTQWFDRYSFVHLAWGAVFEASRVPDALALGSHVAFEAIENSLKDASKRMWPDSRHDSIQNSVGDVASFAAGYYATRALKDSDVGRGVVTGFVAAAAAVWIWNVLAGHTWKMEG
jgi:hypothetical protein